MNAQREFNVLNLRPDLGDRLAESGAHGAVSRLLLHSRLTGVLGAVLSQALIVAAGALFWNLVGGMLGS